MLRQLLFLLCLSSAVQAGAQVSITPIKTNEKQTETQIDYTKIGAPLPPLRVMLHKDTTDKKNKNAKSQDNATKTDAQLAKEARQKKEKEKLLRKGYLTNEDLDNGANLFLMMFNPTCSHCEEATIQLGRNADLFDRSKVVLMANPAMKYYFNDFNVFTHQDEYPFMLMGADSTDCVGKLFLYKPLPQINIYDADRKLIKIFNGDIAIDSLKQYIQ